MSLGPMTPLGSRLRAEKQRKRKTAFISASVLAVCLIVTVLMWRKSKTDSVGSEGAQSDAAEAPAVAGPAAFDTPEKQDEIVRKFFTLCTSGKKFDAACVLDNAEPLCPSRPTTELEIVGQSCGQDRACWRDFLRSCGAFPQK